MIITLPGNPIPQARPRFSTRGKFVQTYDSQDKIKKTLKQKLLCLAKTYGGFIDPTSLPLSIDLSFLVKIPISDPECLKSEKKWGFKLPCNRYAGDLDNLIKFVLDLGNGILWRDDSQIIHLTASKKFSDSPCTIINLKAIKNYMKITPIIAKTFSPEELNDFYAHLMLLADTINQFQTADLDSKDDYLQNLNAEISLFTKSYLPKLKKIAGGKL